MRNFFLVAISIVFCAGILQGQTDETSNEGVSVGTIPEGDVVIVTIDPAMLKQLVEPPSNHAPAPMNYEPRPLLGGTDQHWEQNFREEQNDKDRMRDLDGIEAAITAWKNRQLYMYLGIAGLVVAVYVGYQISVKNKLLAEQIKQSKKSPTPASAESLPEDPPSY